MVYLSASAHSRRMLSGRAAHAMHSEGKRVVVEPISVMAQLCLMRRLSEERKVMPEMKVEKTGEVSANEIIEGETTNPQDQDRENGEEPPTRVAPGRLPARASRS